MTTKVIFAVVLILLAFSCSDNSSPTLQETPGTQDILSSHEATDNFTEDKTKQVLEHHWKAFTENNLEEVMADYVEESVLVTPEATYKGLTQIRQNFENAYIKFPKDKSDFKLTKTVIDRDVAYILWQSKTPTFDLSFATDTFIIRNGKIIRQTYAGVAKAL